VRIRVLSDLHREFGHVPLPEVAADVVVLAGDIDRGTKGVAWARQTFPETPVLYVAGNHEHYDERIGRLHEKLREAAAGSNVHILENDAFELQGYRFFGTTLWTDFNLFGDPPSAMMTAGAKGSGMNDFRKVRRLDTGKFHPKHAVLLHAEARLRLSQFLASDDRARSVVITHHAPSIRSVPAARINDLISAAYASNLDDLILSQGPKLWIHGHIHEKRDYLIGDTRVLNNSLGYQTATAPERTGFIPDLVVKI